MTVRGRIVTATPRFFCHVPHPATPRSRIVCFYHRKSPTAIHLRRTSQVVLAELERPWCRRGRRAVPVADRPPGDRGGEHRAGSRSGLVARGDQAGQVRWLAERPATRSSPYETHGSSDEGHQRGDISVLDVAQVLVCANHATPFSSERRPRKAPFTSHDTPKASTQIASSQNKGARNWAIEWRLRLERGPQQGRSACRRSYRGGSVGTYRVA